MSRFRCQLCQFNLLVKIKESAKPTRLASPHAKFGAADVSNSRHGKLGAACLSMYGLLQQFCSITVISKRVQIPRLWITNASPKLMKEKLGRLNEY